MLLYILSRVIEREERDRSETPTLVAGLQLPIIHQSLLTKLNGGVLKSYGGNSSLTKAVRYACADLTALLNETAKSFGRFIQHLLHIFFCPARPFFSHFASLNDINFDHIEKCRGGFFE